MVISRISKVHLAGSVRKSTPDRPFVDFPEFVRHLIALKSKSMRGIYERLAIHRRVQARSG